MKKAFIIIIIIINFNKVSFTFFFFCHTVNKHVSPSRTNP